MKTSEARALERLMDEIHEVRGEVARLREEVAPPPLPTERPNILTGCFPEQLSFIQDQSPFKAAFCTRRGAKSYSIALDFINDSFDWPRAHYLILGLTRLGTKDIYWDNILKDIDRRFALGAKFNETELTMRMPNGALIKLAGADADEDERAKYLGGKKRKVAVDEGQSFGTDLRDLVMGVLKPSVMDLDGQVVMAGTPGNILNSFFHQVTKECKAGQLSPPGRREPGWSLHSWVTTSNPYTRRQFERDIAGFLAADPAYAETPWFRRMYLGEWVVDLESLVYRFDPARNYFSGKLPNWEGRDKARGSWHYILAIDLGYYPDPSAFVVYAYHDFDTTLYGLESWKQWRMDITDIAHKVQGYEQRYTFDSYVIDGANKMAVEEMRRRHNLPLEAADKTGKSDFIELMNAELILGRIKFDASKCDQGVPDTRPIDLEGKPKKPESLALADEYAGLIWDPRKMLQGKREEHPGCPNHLTDAALYGWRKAYQYLSKAPEKPPVPFTEEWFKREIDKMQEQEQAALEERVSAEREGLPDPSDWESWAT